MKFIRNMRDKFAAAKAGRSVLGRAAITLVELTLVLALAAIVVFVAVRAYSNAQENSRIQQTASAVGQVRAVVESLAQGQANYTNVASYASIKGSLPASFDNGTNLVQPFGSLTVAPNAAGDEYTITLAGLNTDACQRLAVMDMGKSVVSTKAGAGAKAPAAGAIYVPADALSDCATPTIEWTFH